MKYQYLRTMLEKELKERNVNNNILQNPRIKEIGDVIISLLKQMGDIRPDLYAPLYESQMKSRLAVLLQTTNCIIVDENGSININVEEFNMKYLNKSEGKDCITFEMLADETTLARTSKNDKDGKIISIFNQMGIEKGKKVEKDEKTLMITRLKEYSHIVEVSKDEEKKYYDISQTEHPEDIQIEGAIEITKDQIKELDSISKIRMIDKVKYTPYKEGVKVMYDIEESLEENKEREE